MLGLMLFGSLLVLFVLARERRRRWRRWEMDPRLQARYGGPWAYPRSYGTDPREGESAVEQLETRVAQLEERLDFTEKLLMERSQKAE